MGDAALRAKDYTTAEADFRQAVSYGDWNADASAGLADALAGQGRTAEAMRVYRALFYGTQMSLGMSSGETAALQDPTRNDFGSEAFPAWMKYAILLDRTGQWSEAVNVYEKALPHLGVGTLPGVDVHFDPAVPVPDELAAAAHLALGIDASNRLEHSDALSEYGKALRLQPTSGLINFYYGYGLQKLGRTAQASIAFLKTVKMAKGVVKVAAEQALKKQKKPV